jgi:SAM-dependent methyltransferase
VEGEFRPAEGVSFETAGEFLAWWLGSERLSGKASKVLNTYYSNYKRYPCEYLRESWSDRHRELDREIIGLKHKVNPKILDLGCGTGTVALYVAYKVKGKAEVLGVDIKDDRLFCANERKIVLKKEMGVDINCEFRNESLLEMDKKDNFDLVYLEEALHHMEPRCGVMQKIPSLIKRGGCLIISEANGSNPIVQLLAFRKRGFQSVRRRKGSNGKEILYGVERVMTANQIIKWFKTHQLRLQSLRYFGLFGSRLGALAETKRIRLFKVERYFQCIPFLSHIFSAHYNIVFTKH